MQAKLHQIRCSINNCHYWSEGNLCSAGEILVTSGTNARTIPDTIDAPYAAQMQKTPVSHNYESCCNTFVLKTDFSQNIDMVLKE